MVCICPVIHWLMVIYCTAMAKETLSWISVFAINRLDLMPSVSGMLQVGAM